MVDACVLVNFVDEAEVIDRLSAGWREYLSGGRPGPHSIVTSIIPPRPLPNPLGEALLEASVPGGLPGTNISVTCAQHLDAHGIARAVAYHDAASYVSSWLNSRLSVELVRAWLGRFFFQRNRHLTRLPRFMRQLLAQGSQLYFTRGQILSDQSPVERGGNRQ